MYVVLDPIYGTCCVKLASTMCLLYADYQISIVIRLSGFLSMKLKYVITGLDSSVSLVFRY